MGKVMDLVLFSGMKHAVKFIQPDHVLKATRRGKDNRANHIEILVTVGKPNFRERAFIKACKKAGEPFPIKKIQVK
jgi:hypothetical protein